MSVDFSTPDSLTPQKERGSVADKTPQSAEDPSVEARELKAERSQTIQEIDRLISQLKSLPGGDAERDSQIAALEGMKTSARTASDRKALNIVQASFSNLKTSSADMSSSERSARAESDKDYLDKVREERAREHTNRETNAQTQQVVGADMDAANKEFEELFSNLASSGKPRPASAELTKAKEAYQASMDAVRIAMQQGKSASEIAALQADMAAKATAVYGIQAAEAQAAAEAPDAGEDIKKSAAKVVESAKAKATESTARELAARKIAKPELSTADEDAIISERQAEAAKQAEIAKSAAGAPAPAGAPTQGNPLISSDAVKARAKAIDGEAQARKEQKLKEDQAVKEAELPAPPALPTPPARPEQHSALTPEEKAKAAATAAISPEVKQTVSGGQQADADKVVDTTKNAEVAQAATVKKSEEQAAGAARTA